MSRSYITIFSILAALSTLTQSRETTNSSTIAILAIAIIDAFTTSPTKELTITFKNTRYIQQLCQIKFIKSPVLQKKP